LITVGQLLGLWVEADQPWKPSTLVGNRSLARALRLDPVGDVRVCQLTPRLLRAALTRWEQQGCTVAVLGARFRVLRSAIGWAWTERLVDVHPIRYMRGPARPPARQPLSDTDVHQLLAAADLAVLEALANTPEHPNRAGLQALQRAEQDLLMVRLAADTGARRGELATLQFTDLTGRVLQIARAVSAGQLTTPKSGHPRTLTLGATTVALWAQLHQQWLTRAQQPIGPWMFAADPAHQHRLGAEVLGHRFARLAATAGVPAATLHRLRHHLATHLVRQGRILDAQARLGHADAATTLRVYAHALPGTDLEVADLIDDHLRTPPPDRPTSRAPAGRPLTLPPDPRHPPLSSPPGQGDKGTDKGTRGHPDQAAEP
jgi:integrase